MLMLQSLIKLGTVFFGNKKRLIANQVWLMVKKGVIGVKLSKGVEKEIIEWYSRKKKKKCKYMYIYNLYLHPIYKGLPK